MRELIRRRLHGDESGVTLVIVALCLIALFGMLVLVVDVGGLLLNRREMVNASDAAALAAAKSCILPPSIDPRSPEQAADEFAFDNSSRAQTAGTNITQISGCDTSATGYVSVAYSANQHLFFAPVLGAGTDRTVGTTATAIWGPAGAANPLPIVMYQHSFNNCKFNAIDPTKTCYVWEDNNNVNGAQNAFGLLDLRTDNPSAYGWNSDAGAGCSNPGNGPKNWIDNYPDSSIGDLPLNYPNPTYVCKVNGFVQSAWDGLNRLIDDNDVADQNDDEDVLFFPINRCEDVVPNSIPGGQLAKNSTSEAPCSATPGQYDIIGYAAMKLEAVYRKGDPGVSGASGSCPNNTTLGPAGLGNYGLGGWPLNTLAVASCAAPSAPASVTNVVISSGNGGSKVIYNQCSPTAPAPPCDYVWDSVTHTVHWFNAATRNGADTYDIDFDWTLPGVCGIPPSGNASGHCLVLLPVDVKIGGSKPGGGLSDSNVRAYKLCESTIAGSCDPVAVP